MAALLQGTRRAAGADVDLNSLVSVRHYAQHNSLDVELYHVAELHDAGRYSNVMRCGASPETFAPVAALDDQQFHVVVPIY